ncbi:unnamed protein product [Lampetra fluviatilis]
MVSRGLPTAVQRGVVLPRQLADSHAGPARERSKAVRTRESKARLHPVGLRRDHLARLHPSLVILPHARDLSE